MKSKNTHKTPSLALDGRTPSDEYLNTLSAQQPRMTALFESFSAGQVPDFLAIMAAISENVAFSTDHDLTAENLGLAYCNMSQKKCRFCS